MVCAIVEWTQHDLIKSCFHAAADVGKDVGRMFGQDFLKRPIDFSVPIAARLQACRIGAVERFDDLADDANVRAEARFIGCISAPGVIEIDVKAESNVDFVVHAASLEFSRSRTSGLRKFYLRNFIYFHFVWNVPSLSKRR